jgi:hypothetical protein
MQDNKNRFRIQSAGDKAKIRATEKRPSKQNYPEGPNEKQGYPDPEGEKPNSDDLHTEQNIEKSPDRSVRKDNARKKEGQKNYYGWDISIRNSK